MTLLGSSSKRPRRNRPLKNREIPAQHRTRTKRSRFRIWLIGIAMVMMAAMGLIGGKDLIKQASEWTSVEQVTVMGLQHVSREEVLRRLNLPQQASLLWLSTEELAQNVRAHSWVDAVEVDRVLPHSLVVQVTEREPVAVLRASPESVLLDAEGRVLPGDRGVEVTRLPILKGLIPQAVEAHGEKGHPRAKQGVMIAKLLARYFSERPQVNVGDPYSTVVDLPQVRFQFGEHAEEQWQRFLVLYPTLKSEMDGQAQEVDLRFSQKVILRKRTL